MVRNKAVGSELQRPIKVSFELGWCELDWLRNLLLPTEQTAFRNNLNFLA